MMRSKATMLLAVMGLLAALLSPAAALSISPSLITDDHHRRLPAVSLADDGLNPDYYDDTCPNVLNIVGSVVEEALKKDITLAAGLLRLFYHDCFPQGCDASILLEGADSELQMPPNRFLRRSAVQLIEAIRIKVHAACGPVVSCADIMAVATHDAILASGGQPYLVPLGRLDSLEPASLSAVDELPLPTFNVSQLIASFGSRGLDKEDLVALSGAHTIGKAHCASFADRFDADDSDFVRAMQHNCTASNGARKQDLDVATPTTFDDSYFGNLLAGKGVLTSDVQLLQDPRAMELVEGVATNEWWFWNQFDTSIRKLGLLQGPNGNVGEVRSISCSVRNHRSNDAA